MSFDLAALTVRLTCLLVIPESLVKCLLKYLPFFFLPLFISSLSFERSLTCPGYEAFIICILQAFPPSLLPFFFFFLNFLNDGF